MTDLKNLVARLRASLRMDTINGDSMERSVCAKQMREAADTIERLERERDALNIKVNYWREKYDAAMQEKQP